MPWSEVLRQIRSGDEILQTTPDGLPVVAVNAPVYELMQLLVALTEGYNRNTKRIRMLRKLVHNNQHITKGE